MIRPLLKVLRRIKTNLLSSPPAKCVWTNRHPRYAPYDIGDWTYGEPEIRDFQHGATLTIGRFCSIAKGVKILVGGEHRTDWITTFPFAELMPVPPEARSIVKSKGNIVIGHDVWLGTDVLVLSGVEIGHGAVVAARSVVCKPVKPYSVVAGNPAKHIRFRIPEEHIADMLRIAWWNWPVEEVLNATPLLLSSSFPAFIAHYGSQVLVTEDLMGDGGREDKTRQ